MSKNFATPPNLSEAAPRLGWRCFEGYETDTDVVWELSVLGCFCWQQNPGRARLSRTVYSIIR